MSIHEVGNSQSSERKNCLQRSSGSSAVLGDMVNQRTLTVRIEVHPLKMKFASWSRFKPFADSVSAVYRVSLVYLFRPHVKSPCRADQATWLWLHGEDEEQKRDFISKSPHQVLHI